MNQKIGTFLMVMLVLTTVLVLMATPRNESRAPATEPVQTTAAAPESTSDGDESTREPVTAAPQETAAPPQTEEQPRTADVVKRILDRKDLQKTAATVYADLQPGQIEDALGREGVSAAHALAQISGERKMNPIAAFWVLVNEGMYEKQEDRSDAMKSAVFTAPAQEKKQYPYTAGGSRELLTDLMALSARISDDVDLEAAVLGLDQSLEPEQMNESGADDCRYAYFSASSEYATHILCFYLRSDGEGKWIDDVEFQLLSIRHAGGKETALNAIDEGFARQAVSLMAAAELLLTGSTNAGSGEIPMGYLCGGHRVTIDRYTFTAQNESGTLTNYRLRAK